MIHEVLAQLGDGIEDFLPVEMKRRLRIDLEGSAFRGVAFSASRRSDGRAGLRGGPFHRRLIFGSS